MVSQIKKYTYPILATIVGILVYPIHKELINRIVIPMRETKWDRLSIKQRIGIHYKAAIRLKKLVFVAMYIAVKRLDKDEQRSYVHCVTNIYPLFVIIGLLGIVKKRVH